MIKLWRSSLDTSITKYYNITKSLKFPVPPIDFDRPYYSIDSCNVESGKFISIGNNVMRPETRFSNEVYFLHFVSE